jgi:hypothetical protein
VRRGTRALGGAVVLAAVLAAACRQTPLTEIGEGWFIDKTPPSRPAAHLYFVKDDTRVLVDRQVEGYRLYYSMCLVYQVSLSSGHVLLGGVGTLTPIAIATNDPLHPWRFDDDALRRYETAADPDGRSLLKITSMKIGEICGKMQMQPAFTEERAARARATPAQFPVEETVLEVNGADSVGNSTLSDEAQEGHAATVDELLRAGADPNSANQAGVTVLMTAIAFQHPEAARRLIAAGARVNAQDDRGMTALMVAAKYRSPEIAQALLDAGADPTVRDDSGQNAAGWVSDSGGPELQALRDRLERAAAARQR